MSVYQHQSSSNSQTQSQKYQNKSRQVEAEDQIVKYTVRQDFLNLLTIAADYQAGLNYSGNKKNMEQILIMLQNKLILQVNLSSSIHQDQQQQCKNSPQLNATLMKEKGKVKEFLKIIINEQKFAPQIEKYLECYLNKCLNEYPILVNEPLNPVKHKAEFNQDTLQKVLCSINQTDQNYSDIYSGKVQAKELSQSDIDKRIQERINTVNRKLEGSQERGCNWCQLI
ncbi:unnamed protein product (macronuclear) [Paramecium tetraurelia]|uniref:Uncharacterized protein n=1 Tax=Paramecium tetraurelia TaxID=5888 RepID=A0E659_PARTE|nr:uncharacterized protein GSPATT00003640001 [Paramecium tetraurelia]CAK90776.1 unnamed protein product [Paramecium tetraurelia]|eukprot:XP_001458173.1 hypothetical protein (macronuclear) [Paramecium tetraurelia strain d4-2]